MTYTIEARPTTYKGVQMRSRLEAKVAAHFDKKGWDWEYEPVCFAGDKGQYLPDFRITYELFYSYWCEEEGEENPISIGKFHTYIEVKPTYAMAAKALEKMKVIWESENTATLEVWIGTKAVLRLLGALPTPPPWPICSLMMPRSSACTICGCPTARPTCSVPGGP